jgi:hypothetical protein
VNEVFVDGSIISQLQNATDDTPAHLLIQFRLKNVMCVTPDYHGSLSLLNAMARPAALYKFWKLFPFEFSKRFELGHGTWQLITLCSYGHRHRWL